MTTWILYHIFCLLSTVNFIFLKFFLIVCFSKTIICDSSVIIPLGVMLVNHKIQIFLVILFVSLNVIIFLVATEKWLRTSHFQCGMWTVRGKFLVPHPTLLPTTQDRAQSRPHPSFTQLTTSRGAGVCPGNSAGGSKLLGLRGAALFSKILLSERRESEFRIFGNGFSRSTES